jgi:hypothetical protein
MVRQPTSANSDQLTTSWFHALLFVLITFAACAQAADGRAELKTEPASAQQPLIISVKKPELKNDNYHLTEVEIIKLALDKTMATDGPYEIREIPSMNRARTLSALTNNIYPNLALMMSYDDEIVAPGLLRYIDIPIDFGANSYRICLMRQDLKDELAKVTSVEQLRKYTFGAGIGWLDVKILRHNNFKVIEQNNAQNIVRMTKAGRVDLFCRGFGEIFFELQHDVETTGLAYDETFAIYYPLPKFLFLHHSSAQAFERIKRGLMLADRDGSLKQLWFKNNQLGIEKSHLKKRRIFKLEKPIISHLSGNYERYFYDPRKAE